MQLRDVLPNIALRGLDPDAVYEVEGYAPMAQNTQRFLSPMVQCFSHASGMGPRGWRGPSTSMVGAVPFHTDHGLG